MARRFWSGRFGYLYKFPNSSDNVVGCGDETQARWLSYQSDIARTKYLGLDIDSSWSQTMYDYSGGDTPTTSTVTETMSVSQAIDGHSGLLTFDDLSISPNDDRNHALNLCAPAFWTWADIINRMTVPITPTPFGGSMLCSGNTITVQDSAGRTVEQDTFDLTEGSFNRVTYDYDSLGTQLPLIEESVSVSDTAIHYSLTTNDYNTNTGSGLTLSSSTVLTVTGTLTLAHTDAEIYSDIKDNLLSVWPLDDDSLYPWRIDLKVSAAPLVSRDEIFTQGFTQNWWVKDYGHPISDLFGSYGDPAWQGHCGIALSPDSTTGKKILVLDWQVTAGDVLHVELGGQFSFCATTGYTIIGGSLPPGVSFDDSTGIIDGTVSADGHWGVTIQATGAAAAVTGEILGTPKPAGYQNYFDFGYRDWLGCCYRPPDNPGHQTWSWYQHGWGMDVSAFNFSSGCQLPLNTTQWTNYFQSVNKPQGAFLFYNDTGQDYFGIGCVSSDATSGTLDGDALWACKYAEIPERWFSQNFARPAGGDKFAFDENRVYCAVNVSGTGEGSTWTLTDPVTGIAPPDAADFSGVWGGAVVGGFFNVASYSSGTLTLGSKVYDVPGNWSSQSNHDEEFCFGKLRFPTCPALLGRIGIVPDEDGATFTFESPQTNFGLDSATHQEQIDLFDKDMNILTSDVAAARIDDSHFSIAGNLPNSRFVMIHGAAKWYMNDTGPKGDYALLEWLSDFRSNGEFARLTGVLDCSETQVAQPTQNVGGGPVTQPFASFSQTPGCLPFTPCSPKVICISPNGETFPNGITYPFPENFACDEQYGSKWWAYVQTTMTDLFWQRPHRPCNIQPCAKWLMDGGTCADDEGGSCPGDEDYIPDESSIPTYYFGHAPQVEARLTVPCNYGLNHTECAPALPAEVQIGWLSPVHYDTGDIALPPQPPGALEDRGEPAGASTAWDFHSLLCSHSTGCRFNYQTPGCE